MVLARPGRQLMTNNERTSGGLAQGHAQAPVQASSPIRFYFDFSSPYAYLAATRIDTLCRQHGRDVDWRPVLLGIVFRETGNRPLMEQPVKGDYARHDLGRCARYLGLPFVFPETFPFASVAAARAVYWLKDRNEALAHRLARALFDAAFGSGRDISTVAAVIEIAASAGVERAELARALQEPAVKARLRTEIQSAIAVGVCGAPFFLVDGEPFWGADRLDHVERWLAAGGW